MALGVGLAGVLFSASLACVSLHLSHSTATAEEQEINRGLEFIGSELVTFHREIILRIEIQKVRQIREYIQDL